MRIVRTVGQAFEVCHKMQNNPEDQPVPSTSSVVDEPAPANHSNELPVPKGPRPHNNDTFNLAHKYELDYRAELN